MYFRSRFQGLQSKVLGLIDSGLAERQITVGMEMWQRLHFSCGDEEGWGLGPGRPSKGKHPVTHLSSSALPLKCHPQSSAISWGPSVQNMSQCRGVSSSKRSMGDALEKRAKAG